jgi:hypothetical protein
MFTYQVRERYYKISIGQQFRFPNDFESLFILQPLQPFGVTSGGGRTIVRAKPAFILYNANTGHHTAESKEPLQPLDAVVVEESVRRVEFKGNEFRITGRAETLNEMDDTISSIFFVLPILLNVEMADPPVIERVEGKVGGRALPVGAEELSRASTDDYARRTGEEGQ